MQKVITIGCRIHAFKRNYYETVKTRVLHESPDGLTGKPTDNPPNSNRLVDFPRTVFQLPVQLNLQLVLATGPGNPPAVRVLTCGSVRFGSRTGQKPDPLLSWWVVTWPGHRTAGIWPGWNRTTVPNIQFLQLWLLVSI